jgi:cell division protein FtsB
MAATARRRLAAGGQARPKRAPRARARQRAGVGGIRWDRVARISLLLVLLAVLVSYLGPAADYLESWRLAKQTRTELQDLRVDNERLRERAKLLDNADAIELEARKIGMARPGERAFVVRNLPKD